ncbi:MAG TPA: rhodanese-like domain-containing protein [Holophaga sp.]|nr:rhodanese-like domain-containing protein [Holophaga sp.]
MAFGPLIAPETLMADAASVRLLDARPGAEAYAAGHLRGALHADLDRWLSAASDPGFDPARGGRHPLPAPDVWAARLGSWGIGPGTRVVAYDDVSGGNGACRLWWMMKAFGHAEVAVLDGGLAAARAADLEVTPESPEPPEPLPPYPCDRWTLPRVDMDTVARLLQDPAWKVLDVRSRERWRGEVEAIDPVPGRIPGTVNHPYAENLGPDGRYKSPEELRAMYLRLMDGTPVDHLAVHCGSGVTACHTLLALDLAGLSGASLFVGSYSQWCRSGKPLGKGA